jgi:hypothetical protein
MPSFRFHRCDDATVESLAKKFHEARPFPHIVLDDVIEGDRAKVTQSFPDVDWAGWHKFQDGYQVGKMYCQDIERIPPPWDAMLRELCEPAFLSFLERVTGIDALIPDPYLEGGGLHCSAPGGILAPHTDFHIYRRLNLYRHVNVLVYFNEAWAESDGGCLELYAHAGGDPEVTVVPTWGRCVIFRTDDHSIHGFSKPVVSHGRWRRSLALYYYTSQESPEYSGDTTTYWRTHGDHTGAGRARLAIYRGLIFASRSLAYLAHRLNPNLGRRRAT